MYSVTERSLHVKNKWHMHQLRVIGSHFICLPCSSENDYKRKKEQEREKEKEREREREEKERNWAIINLLTVRGKVI